MRPFQLKFFRYLFLFVLMLFVIQPVQAASRPQVTIDLGAESAPFQCDQPPCVVGLKSIKIFGRHLPNTLRKWTEVLIDEQKLPVQSDDQNRQRKWESNNAQSIETYERPAWNFHLSEGEYRYQLYLNGRLVAKRMIQVTTQAQELEQQQNDAIFDADIPSSFGEQSKDRRFQNWVALDEPMESMIFSNYNASENRFEDHQNILQLRMLDLKTLNSNTIQGTFEMHNRSRSFAIESFQMIRFELLDLYTEEIYHLLLTNEQLRVAALKPGDKRSVTFELTHPNAKAMTARPIRFKTLTRYQANVPKTIDDSIAVVTNPIELQNPMDYDRLKNQEVTFGDLKERSFSNKSNFAWSPLRLELESKESMLLYLLIQNRSTTETLKRLTEPIVDIRNLNTNQLDHDQGDYVFGFYAELNLKPSQFTVIRYRISNPASEQITKAENAFSIRF